MKELLKILPDRQLSLSEFVDWMNNPDNLYAVDDCIRISKDQAVMANGFIAITRYNNFLKQPLELRMIVPCDEEGKVLEGPEYNKYRCGEDGSLVRPEYLVLKKEYQKAKEMCLYDENDTHHYNIVGDIEHYKVEGMKSRKVTSKFWKECLNL